MTRMRPRRTEQCLPQENATPAARCGRSMHMQRGRVEAYPALPDPRFAEPLVRHFGALFYSKELRHQVFAPDRLLGIEKLQGLLTAPF